MTDGSTARPVVVERSLDNLRSRDVRFLQEAARLGPVHVRIPSDALVAARTDAPPLFPANERLFLAASFRWVDSATIEDRPTSLDMPALAAMGASLVVGDGEPDPAVQAAAEANRVAVHTVSRASCEGFPLIDVGSPPIDVPRVVVTGCYDWLHSGHIRFFMDAAAYGALHVVVGSDRNVELLKGLGHPLQREEERRFMVSSIESVHRGMISSGSGWIDAEPEIAEIEPTHYVVNEDGDQPEKREFCRAHGIQYIVLERRPHSGLPARSSTTLRGF